MKRALVLTAAATVVTLAVLAIVYQRNLERAAFAASLFSGAEQYEYFDRLDELYPVSRMTASANPFHLSDGPSLVLPASFVFAGREVSTDAFLAETDTAALLVLKDGAVRFEQYWLTGGRDVRWLSMSVAKSFVSAAIGIAIAEGRIGSVEEPITKYAPSLAGSAYDGVRIKDILQMSSGARWNEDYGDSDSDISRFGRIMALGGSFNDFAATLVRERDPGSYNLYNSIDTQVLGMLLVRATGQGIADYLQQKLWHPLGMESDAFWLVDSEGMEMAFGGLNATARDYAKLGELYRQGGVWRGEQIVPASWVHDSVTPDAPHLMPGENPLSDYPMGYGYQWWVMEGDEGEYSAIGVYNQFIYVNPKRGLVIVKLSAFSDYAQTPDEAGYREFETIEFFRAIGRALD